MKKLLFLFIITFISLFVINIDRVYSYECIYGDKYDVKDSKGNVISQKWRKQIKIGVTEYGDYYPIADSDSRLLKTYLDAGYGTLAKKNVDGIDYFYSKKGNSDFRLYISMYPSEDVYKDSNNKCPEILRYKHMTDSKGNIYALYHDDLDSVELQKKKSFWDLFFKNKVKEEGYYFLESAQDKSEDELIDKYSCMTYTVSIKKLKEAKEKYGTCDNNSDFTYEYRKIYSLCESFRATSSYTSEDDNGEIGAKSCMTACSNLKDDVAQICQREPGGVVCGSLGQKIVKWMYKIIRMVRYVVPILIIILSILDYIKAIGSDSEDEMKKATGKFFKRLIVAAIIFIIPFILEFILGIFHLPGLNSNNPFCAN